MEGINFNKMPLIYWTDEMKLSYLQRVIIINSIMYYELDDTCMTDREYDIISKQYIKMAQKAHKDAVRQTDYYYCMYDFDGTTGFDLYSRLTKHDKKYLKHIAEHILRMKGKRQW